METLDKELLIPIRLEDELDPFETPIDDDEELDPITGKPIKKGVGVDDDEETIEEEDEEDAAPEPAFDDEEEGF